MKFSSILCLTAMAAALAACTGLKEEPVQEGERVVTLTGTIGLDSNTETRALTALGKKSFAVGEKIAVVYKNTSDVTVKAESEALTAADIYHYGKKAIITVTLTNPQPNGALTYIYPAAMAKADGSVNYTALDNQDGTLATLSSDLDLCTFTGKLTSAAELPEDANLANGITIGEFTFNNNGGTDITDALTDITVSDGTNSYVVTPGAISPIYVAMQPIYKDQTISFTAHNGSSETFIRSVTGKILYAGHIYPVNVRLNRRIDLSALTADFEAREDDWLTGSLANNVKISIASGASITLSDADINGSGSWTSGDYAGINCIGAATITLDGTSSVKGFAGAYPGIFVPSGKTLTLKGDGTLTVANNGGTGAGVGAGSAAGGNVTISGSCTINATGGTGSAGIGASNAATGGNVNISGSVTVTAIGGANAAGIGAGNEKNSGTIYISGGTVTGIGGANGSGIGGAYNSVSGRIDFKAGLVKVTGIKGTGAKDGFGRGTAKSGDVYFKDTRRYRGDGSYDVWSPNPMKNGTYDGFVFTITTTTNTNDTWTIIPS